jgi:hypothetical protein
MSCEVVALTWEKERSGIFPHECKSKGTALYFVCSHGGQRESLLATSLIKESLKLETAFIISSFSTEFIEASRN